MFGAQSDVETVRSATLWLHRVLPDLDAFNLSVEAAHGLPVAASDLWLPLCYALGYVVVLLLAAVALFERRDFR